MLFTSFDSNYLPAFDPAKAAFSWWPLTFESARRAPVAWHPWRSPQFPDSPAAFLKSWRG